MAQLSIIIVNYRSREMMETCLNKLHQNTTCDYEVIVVNNDETEKDLTNLQHPRVKILEMGYNAGFARANNKGIQESKAPFILLMNPDVFVSDDAISQCLNRFNGSPYSGAGIQLLNEDDSPQISGSHFPTGGINHFLPLPVLGTLMKGIAKAAGAKETSVKKAGGEQQVDWINGAFLMVKRNQVQKAGMLDEDFFLYAEEIEWCSRLRKIAPMVVYGDLKAHHLQGEVANSAFGSSGKGYFNLFDKKGLQILVSNFVRIRKQFGTAWFIIHMLVYIAEIPLLLIYSIFSKSITNKQWWGYVRNMSKLIKLSPTIIRNEPHFYKML